MDTDRARDLLTAQLEQVETDLRTEVDDRTPEDGAEGGTRVMDFGDAGSQAAEQMDGDLAVGTLRDRREQTLAALRRLDDGTYGACRVCGRPIDDERIEARPETELCREHRE